jgi:hypothetical protein
VTTPRRPGLLHVAAMVGMGGTPIRLAAIVADTTSPAWPDTTPPDVITLSMGEAAQLRASPRVRTGLATDGPCSAHDRPVRELEEPGNDVLGRASKALRGRLAAIVSARPAVIAGVSNDKDSSQHARARWWQSRERCRRVTPRRHWTRRGQKTDRRPAASPSLAYWPRSVPRYPAESCVGPP